MAVTKTAPIKHDIDTDGSPVDFGIPRLARTSKAVRSETLKAYYKHNTFHVDCVCWRNEFEACKGWIEQRMKDGYWSSMRPLQVAVCCLSEHQVMEAFQQQFPDKKVNIREIGLEEKFSQVFRSFEVRVEDFVLDA